MTDEELQKSINYINETDLTDAATFGIFTKDNDWDEIMIKANKEGLQLFALQLLKASQQTKKIVDIDNQIIPLNTNAEWINPKSDIKIFYVQQVDKENIETTIDSVKETFGDKLIKYGFISILILLFIAALIGLWTLGKWIF